ncbi:MAG: DUF3343 domain-containing protein [Eggerthellaceae bacterium]|jgi:hypothetical protein
MVSVHDMEARISAAQAANPGKRIDCYMLFDTHLDAMALHEAARAQGIPARVSATPRQARACCGVALLVMAPDAPAILELAQDQNLPYEDMVALPCQIDPHRDRYC